jgi:hypothetical protein
MHPSRVKNRVKNEAKYMPPLLALNSPLIKGEATMEFRELDILNAALLSKDTDIAEPIHIEASLATEGQVPELASRGAWFNLGIVDRFMFEKQQSSVADILTRGFLADYSLYDEVYKFHFPTAPFDGVRPPYDKEIMWLSERDASRFAAWMAALAVMDPKGEKGEKLFRIGIQSNKMHLLATKQVVKVHCPVVLCSKYALIYGPSDASCGLLTKIGYQSVAHNLPDLLKQEEALEKLSQPDVKSVFEEKPSQEPSTGGSDNEGQTS